MLNSSLNLSKDIFDSNIKLASTRDGFGDELVEMGSTYADLIVLTGDLMESTRVHKFADKFPERFIEVGVAEQNMAGIAAGLALSGKIPVMTSYASFSPGRNWDQIKTSIAYGNANVKIVSSHSGFTADMDGATHQSYEDIALTRVLPNMTVLYPADYIQSKKALQAAIKIEGPVYIRIAKTPLPVFTTDETPFVVGKPQILKEGTDVTIIATGTRVYDSLLASRELAYKHKIDAEVINLHTIKPIREEILVESAKKTNLVLTVEEHQISCGMGGAVSELLGAFYPVKVARLGMNDTFGESGKYEDLIKKYKVDKETIVNTVLNLTKEKNDYAKKSSKKKS